jgi:hypothetical protein
MKKIFLALLLACLFLIKSQVFSQENKILPLRGDYRIMFYNVENLFNTVDDTLVNDSEFLPEGKKKWTYEKYNKKLKNIFRVISAVGEWKSPEIIGLCEIENREVLEDLIRNTPLKKAGYAIVHKDSPDERGIDVALMYNKKAFKPLKYKLITVDLPQPRSRPTRDILYVKGVLGKKDTMHIFVNHWPSRMGGQKESEPKRVFTASLLRQKIDSLFRVCKNPKIVVMGDLNDDPVDISLTEGLKSFIPKFEYQPEEMYNLSYVLFKEKNLGSLKYKANWNLFDQMVVSGALLTEGNGVFCKRESAYILQSDFLLEPDEKFMGKQPFRTFAGDQFIGGFSDHLPVYLDLFLSKNQN